MAILEKEVLMTCGNRNDSLLESLGYVIPRKENGKVSNGTKIEVKIEDIPKNSHVKVTKICDECGKEIPNQRLHTIMMTRSSDGKDYCKVCGLKNAGRTRKNNVLFENSLEYYAIFNNEQYLLEEFSDKNTRKPSEISRGDNDKFLWNCLICKSEFPMSANKRISGKQGCPYCSCRKVNETNCLATTNPELAKEWHPTKNGELTPYNITRSAKRKVWWKCEKCKSDFDATLNDRSNGKGCSYCSGRKVNHTNCLSVTFPNLAEEWSYDLNNGLTPEKVTKGTNKKVWWTCPQCNKPYDSTILNRVYGGNGCPNCKKSKGHKEINNFLECLNVKYTNEKKFKKCKDKKRLPFDVYINELNILIEYDGEHHFMPVDFSGSSKDLAIKQFSSNLKHDKIKNQYCINNNIPLIRIPYWEFDNIDYILENVLIHYNLIDNKNNTYDKEIVHKYLVDQNWNQDKYISEAPCNKNKIINI